MISKAKFILVGESCKISTREFKLLRIKTLKKNKGGLYMSFPKLDEKVSGSDRLALKGLLSLLFAP